MKIVKAIKDLYARLKALSPVPGDGIDIQRTATGTIISLEPRHIPAGEKNQSPSVKGMFHIERVDEKNGKGQYVVVHDTSTAAERQDGEDENSPPKYAGEVYVNNRLRGNALAFSHHPNAAGLYYIYVHFNAAAGEDGGGNGQGGDNGGEEEPAAQELELVCTAAQLASDDMNVYSLIGRVRFSSQGKEIDGETTTVFTVADITQDHTPLGPVYLAWETSDGGPTGPFDSRLWKDATTGNWLLRCYDSSSPNSQVAGYWYIYLHSVACQTFTISSAGVLFLDIAYNPTTGYTEAVKYDSVSPTIRQSDRRFVYILATVSYDSSGNRYVLHKKHTPGNITVTGRWL